MIFNVISCSLDAFDCHFSKNCSFFYRNLKLVLLTFLYPLPMPLQKWATIGIGEAVIECLLTIYNNNDSSLIECLLGARPCSKCSYILSH